MKLLDQKCVPCRKDTPPASDAEVAELHKQIPEWMIQEVDGTEQLIRQFTFPNFVEALAFTNLIGGLAEVEDHHPALTTEWGKVTVSWWTHSVGGLHRNDFIAAAKCDLKFTGR